MHKATRKQSISVSTVTMFLSGIMVASAAYRQTTSKGTPNLAQTKLHQVLELDRRLIDSENSENLFKNYVDLLSSCCAKAIRIMADAELWSSS